MLPLRGVIFNLLVQNHLVFGVSLRGGNTEHATFLKKKGTSDANSMIFGIGIEIRNIGTPFSAKKMVKIELEVFLKWPQT